MKMPLPELSCVEELTAEEASQIFEQRVQLFLDAGLLSFDGAGEDARRTTAAGLLNTLYPALVKRLAVVRG